MGLNPARVTCEVFVTDTLKALRMQCYTHVGVGPKLNKQFYHPTQEFHQPIWYFTHNCVFLKLVFR